MALAVGHEVRERGVAVLGRLDGREGPVLRVPLHLEFERRLLERGGVGAPAFDGAGGDVRLKAAVRVLIKTTSTSGAWHVYAQYAAWTDTGYVPTSSQNGYMLIRKLNSSITMPRIRSLHFLNDIELLLRSILSS